MSELSNSNISDIGDMGDINEVNSVKNIENIKELKEIKEIVESNENNKFKNSFPITLNKIKIEKPDRINILNIGQLLFALFLLTVIFTQTINLFSDAKFTLLNSDSIDSIAGANLNENKNSPPAPPQDNINNADNKNISENYLNFDEIGINKIDNADDIYNININQSNSNVVFVLGESEGKLAILSPDGLTVYEIFDVYINTLPEYDRNLLLDGIKITSSEELHSLLEDYSS